MKCNCTKKKLYDCGRSDDEHALQDLSNDFLIVLELLDKNTAGGPPQDADTGECWHCEKGIFSDEEWENDDGYDKITVPRFHKPSCPWRQSRELLDKATIEKRIKNG